MVRKKIKLMLFIFVSFHSPDWAYHCMKNEKVNDLENWEIMVDVYPCVTKFSSLPGRII